jgi:hypothetical protein
MQQVKARYSTDSTGLPLTCQALQLLTASELDQNLNRPLRIVLVLFNVYLSSTADALEGRREPFIDLID